MVTSLAIVILQTTESKLQYMVIVLAETEIFAFLETIYLIV